MDFAGTRILVTGGAGFIGSNLCEALLELGAGVRCFDNFLTGKRSNIEQLLAHPNFELMEGDIRIQQDCESAVAGCRWVLHQAALGSVPRSVADPITTNEINITGFLNIIEASRKAGVERFVYAASSSTYGDHPGLPKVEDKIGKPLSPYAVTKYVNELYADVYGKLHGLPNIGLRYFNVFGRRQDPDGAYAAAIPKFIRAFMRYESPVVHGDGSQTRDFTYIDNVIHANLCALTTKNPEAQNKVYNVAFGESTDLNSLVKILKAELAKFDEKIAGVDISHGAQRVGDVKHSLADISRARNLLGYNPQFNFREGIEKAIEWYWQHYR